MHLSMIKTGKGRYYYISTTSQIFRWDTMKHLYIIDDIAQASCYGVKTYITQIIASWKSSPQGKLTVVKMNGSDNDIYDKIIWALCKINKDSYTASLIYMKTI